MIDIYECEAIVKAYRMITKRCNILDKFIKNHATYFGPCSDEYSAMDAYETIIDLMAKKNQLINLKIMIDKSIDKLSDNDKKTILLKMNNRLSNEELGMVLGIKCRTAYRRLKQAFTALTEEFNRTSFAQKIESIITHQGWLRFLCDSVREKHLNYKEAGVNIL